MPTAHTISATIHGRYLVEGPSAPGPHPTLVGFHGYGEHAAAHLAVLRRIAGARPWRLVSVQGLHRFYTKQEQVVASWMTREDREHAIADNVAYVAAVVAEVQQAHGGGRPLVYAGFSQGVAMAYRAAAHAGHPADGLIVLAGDVPPDVVADARRLPPVLLGRGTADAWYTGAKAAADVAILREAGIPVVEDVFDAGHEWTDGFAARAGAFLDQLTHAL